MSIKKVTKYSFLIVFFLITVIASINAISIIQLRENNSGKKLISTLVRIQKNMNKLILDSIRVKKLAELQFIKTTFRGQEQKFESTKNSIIAKKKDDFLDQFLTDIYRYDVVQQDLTRLFENEKEIENKFAAIFNLQVEKINIGNAFLENYPLENTTRNSIQKIVWSSDDISLIKDFADLKYYSKEALYQHKNQEYLDKWLEKSKLLKAKTNINLFDDYISTIKNLSLHIVRSSQITQKEARLVAAIQEILKTNSLLNDRIEKISQSILDDFINNSNNLLIVLMFLTIGFLSFFARKVYVNIGLSVDEIENKVDQGINEIKNLNREIEITQKEVVFTMGSIGESRSRETGNHVKRVAEYSRLLALYYGLPEDQAEMLKQASPMHDIGKVAIKDSVLNKPGKLDAHEWEIMKTHAELGYEMLKGSNRALLKAAATVAYEHHEKWDGTGYPRGLVGEHIHIYGRITALADVFDALGSDRVYKKAWDDEKIFSLFNEERGKHFDPRLVDIFFNQKSEFLDIRNSMKDVF